MQGRNTVKESGYSSSASAGKGLEGGRGTEAKAQQSASALAHSLSRLSQTSPSILDVGPPLVVQLSLHPRYPLNIIHNLSLCPLRTEEQVSNSSASPVNHIMQGNGIVFCLQKNSSCCSGDPNPWTSSGAPENNLPRGDLRLFTFMQTHLEFPPLTLNPSSSLHQPFPSIKILLALKGPSLSPKEKSSPHSLHLILRSDLWLFHLCDFRANSTVYAHKSWFRNIC